MNSGSKAILKLASRRPSPRKEGTKVASSECRVYMGRRSPTGGGKRCGESPDMGSTKTKRPFVNTAGRKENSSRMVLSE